MGLFLKRLARTALVLVLVYVAITGAVMSFLHSPFFRYPSEGEYPQPRINEIIWPSVGYPAMVVPGEVVVVEVDLWAGEEGRARMEEASGWHARMDASRDELAGLSFELELADARLDAPERWPYRSTEGRSERVWHVSFRLPEEATPELYDLSLEVDVAGERIADGQPHAVAVVEEDDEDLTFITLADIHVHERGNSSLLSTQTDKGISEDGEPLFFEQAVAQVNLVRPDFVLMLGDFVRGQRRPGELLSEYERFYQVLLQLEVPAFLLPGNHDGYVNEIDGKRWYENNLGPLYYSFDVGDCHFTCLDTYQWPFDDRVVMNKLFYMEPRKWQGQVLGAGDESDPATYEGELAWLEEDLTSHDHAVLKVMALHHDPYTSGGKGYSYRDILRFPFYLFAGGGKGREALLASASRHEVEAVFGGHLHVDEIGTVPWEGGEGETVYSCQNCVYFDEGGTSDHYPGYRLVEVEGGDIVSLSYLDGVSSYPFYDGSVPGGETDLDALERPALWWEAGETGQGEWSARVEVGSFLGTGMELAGMVVEAPASTPGGYEVSGAELYRVVKIPGRPGRVLLYLRTDVDAGVAGEDARSPGKPAVKTITVSGSPSP